MGQSQSLEQEIKFYRRQARVNNWDRKIDNNRTIQGAVAVSSGLTLAAVTAYEYLQTGEVRNSLDTGVIYGCVVGGVESLVWLGVSQYYNIQNYFKQRRSKCLKARLDELQNAK